MAPPGRRRPALSRLTALFALVFLFTSTASAASAVLGIDLGTEYIKAALVKPGIPLDIVLTKDSKRKEVSAIAFKPTSKNGVLPKGSFPERFYGSDAVALQARFPSDVYPNLKQLLGVQVNDAAVGVYGERYPAVQVTPTEGHGTVSLASGIFAEGEGTFSVEELLAMELKNVKDNAKVLAGKGAFIEDVVFTVPPFYTVEERRALEVAARLAGLKVLGTVSDGLAVGINYATSRTFPLPKDGKPEVNLVFDMGAGSTSAMVLKFQGKQVKDVGRYNKTVQEVQVLGTGWDRTLGGDALNTLIFNDMISEFVQTPSAKSASITAEKVKAHGRTAAKLFKEAEKVRQVLSANTQTSAFFESLFEDVDFRYKLTRSKFEELATGHAARLEGPINRALEAAGLTFNDIDSVIVHGGATRTPFVQTRLEELAGKSKIKANVNSDEAAVFGAAFKAAGISPSFRVKEIRDQDTQGYTHGIQYMFNLKERDQKIFTPATKIGEVKNLPFQMMGEFEFDMYQALPGEEGTVVKTPVLHFKTGNLTRVVSKMIDGDGCDRETFNNYVQVRLSPVTGTPEVLGAWVTCEAEVEGAKVGIVDGIKGLFGGGKKEQEPLKEGESASSSTSSSSSSSSSSSASASASASASSPAAAELSDAAKDGKNKKKKKEIRSAITYTVNQKGYEKHPRKQFKKMLDRLSAFDASDKSRRTREEVLNSLEAFTYRARDLLDSTSFTTYSTPVVRSSLEEKLSAASDWIYAEGHDAAEDVLRAKLKELKDIVDPVLQRADEAEKRPKAIKDLESAISDLKIATTMVKDAIDKDASAAASSPTPSPSASADPLADLEDSKLKPSSSTETPPFSTDIPGVFTQADLIRIEETITKSNTWLKENEDKQKKLSPTEDAAFSVKEIKDHAKKIHDLITELMLRKQKAIQENAYRAKNPPKAAKKPKKPAKESPKKGEEDDGKESDGSAPGGMTEQEIREALEKAGYKGNAFKIEDLGEGASEEDIKERLRKVSEKKKGEKDEL